jgi:hypothetical protein
MPHQKLYILFVMLHLYLHSLCLTIENLSEVDLVIYLYLKKWLHMLGLLSFDWQFFGNSWINWLSLSFPQ